MLAYVLAFVVGLGSFSLYMAAFFFPEVHRRNDFLWSGVGLFYALVLWVCADRMTGGVLLGQVAGVSLLGWLGWQLVLLRRQIAPLDQQTPLPTADDVKTTLSNFSNSPGRSQLTNQVSQFFGQITGRVQGAIATVTSRPRVEVVSDEPYVPPSLEEFGTAGKEATERFARAAIVDTEAIETAIIDTATVPAQMDQTAENVVNRGTDGEQVAGTPSETGRSRLPGWGKKKASQSPYVRKQFRDENSGSESPSKPGGKPESKPVYVRKQFREQDAASSAVSKNADPKNADPKNAASKQEGKPVYVRKQYREPEPEQPPTATPTIVETLAETSIETSVETLAETPILERTTDAFQSSLVDAASISDAAIAPELLGTIPPTVTAEDIVEELLEDISAQEEGAPPADIIAELEQGTIAKERLDAVLPMASSADPGASAIADAEENPSSPAISPSKSFYGDVTDNSDQ